VPEDISECLTSRLGLRRRLLGLLEIDSTGLALSFVRATGLGCFGGWGRLWLGMGYEAREDGRENVLDESGRILSWILELFRLSGARFQIRKDVPDGFGDVGVRLCGETLLQSVVEGPTLCNVRLPSDRLSFSELLQKRTHGMLTLSSD
jgi:hypothetical protein